MTVIPITVLPILPSPHYTLFGSLLNPPNACEPRRGKRAELERLNAVFKTDTQISRAEPEERATLQPEWETASR